MAGDRRPATVYVGKRNGARWEQKSERLWYLNCLMEEW